MQTQMQQILDRCKEVVARASRTYGIDMSEVRISFDLKGRAAGKAGGKRYGGPGNEYFVKFNRDMLTREAFDHVLNNTVPHEYAHVICFMNPSLGKGHDRGWENVCLALGGSGATRHKEAVVFGKGTTYEYTTDRGQKVRLGDRQHRHVQGGGSYRFKFGKGVVDKSCAHSVVGYQGNTLVNPIVKAPAAAVHVNSALAIDTFIAQQRYQAPVAPKPPVFAAGITKASIARAVMLSGHNGGRTYEEIIAAIMFATGHDRQLARAYYKNNAERVGVPQV
jgi:predicted SprT family Zn-dependent metalloprotease